MAHYDVDPNMRDIDSDDLATWLLFFLESHGATITLTPAHHVHVDLDTMPGLTADVVGRWAPVITTLLPAFREILQARAAVVEP
jgi:hypothetical protein